MFDTHALAVVTKMRRVVVAERRHAEEKSQCGKRQRLGAAVAAKVRTLLLLTARPSS